MFFPRQTSFVALAVSIGVMPTPLVAGPTFADEKINALEGVGITEHLDAQLPLDITFKDDSGNDVVLGQYFTNEKPTPIFPRCAVCCGPTFFQSRRPPEHNHDHVRRHGLV